MAKAMKASELRGKTDEELRELLKTTSSKILDARFQNFTNKLNDTARVRTLRRDLARIETVLSERGAASAQAKAG